MNLQKVVIFGGTGFIGLSLADHFKQKGFIPILIARSLPKDKAVKHQFIAWDGINLDESWLAVLEGACAVVNLAGKTVNCIKTPDNCDLILRSRVDTTLLIGKALTLVANPPKIWIQMSTAHIHGDSELLCTESSTTGYGLAPFVGKAWEKAFLDVLPLDTRGVRLRTSFVIGKGGGTLSDLKRIVKLGLGGTVGKGTQGMSWIHEYDLNEIIYQSIVNPAYKGVYMSTAPCPVSNKEFMYLLRKAMRFPIGVAAPSFMIKFGARYIFKTDPELALYGRYVRSENLPKEGFTFEYPKLQQALEHLLA